MTARDDEGVQTHSIGERVGIGVVVILACEFIAMTADAIDRLTGYLLSGLLAAGIVLWLLPKLVASMGLVAKPRLGFAVAASWFVAGYVLCSLVVFLFGIDMGHDDDAGHVASTGSAAVIGGFLRAAAYSILAAVPEEIVFRGIWHPSARLSIRSAFLILGIAIVFAAAHFPNTVHQAGYFVAVSLVLSAVRQASGSFAPGMYVHTLVNFLMTSP